MCVRTSGKPTSTSRVNRLVRLSVCGSCCTQWSVKAAMTRLHWGHAFRPRRMSATEHAQSRPIRLQHHEGIKALLSTICITLNGGLRGRILLK